MSGLSGRGGAAGKYRFHESSLVRAAAPLSEVWSYLAQRGGCSREQHLVDCLLYLAGVGGWRTERESSSVVCVGDWMVGGGRVGLRIGRSQEEVRWRCLGLRRKSTRSTSPTFIPSFATLVLILACEFIAGWSGLASAEWVCAMLQKTGTLQLFALHRPASFHDRS